MPNVQVRCTVDNCYFWAQDNFCNADSILITSSQAAQQYSQETSNTGTSTQAMVSAIGETPADHSHDTACKTFRRR